MIVENDKELLILIINLLKQKNTSYAEWIRISSFIDNKLFKTINLENTLNQFKDVEEYISKF